MMLRFITHVVVMLRLHTERHVRQLCHHAGIALCDNMFQAQFCVYPIAMLVLFPTPQPRRLLQTLSTYFRVEAMI